MSKDTISHYRIDRKLGAGGMGEVYLAKDQLLDRLVALKFLPAEFVSDSDRLRRFIREAKAASSINHPNVAHIYEIGEENGTHFIAMEYVAGESLAARMNRAPMGAAEIQTVAIQVLEALEEAHSKGVIHRDIKPQNIMLSSSGRVKLVDFGLARVEHQVKDVDSLLSTSSQTELGAVIGTLPYMSPEQLLGRKVDHRTDFFSFGIVLYQMATGKLPFRGNTAPELADAILHKTPDPAESLNHELSPAMAKTIWRMLSKERDARHETAGQIAAELRQIAQQPPPSVSAFLRRPALVIPLVLLLLSLFGVAGWYFNRNAKIRWAREQALPEATALADEGKFKEAVAIAVQAEKYIPSDPVLKGLWPQISASLSVKTDPPEAKVFLRDYDSSDDEWTYYGETPIRRMRIPRGYYRLKIQKAGFPEIFTITPRYYPELLDTNLSYSLNLYKQNPQGMVRIPGTKSDSRSVVTDLNTTEVEDDYWLDQYEVTCADFQKFVDAGGYQNKEYWKVPFTKDGRTMSFDEAMKLFRDATSRPGPMEWEVGHYLQGQADLPVTGISWFEAAAYAQFAGKSLPTIYHWYHASGSGMNSKLLPISNFGGTGPHAVGIKKAMGPYGVVDMAGNVSEWCWNESSPGSRYVLGGSYADPVYMFTELNPRSPFSRDKTIGFRCLKYLAGTPAGSLSSPFIQTTRDYVKEKPVDDQVFSVLKTFYDYEKKDLNSRKEASVDQGNAIREKITFDAAYGNERMIAYVFTPKNIRPPYQTVVYFPGAGAGFFTSSELHLNRNLASYIGFVIRSGRAFVYPVYKGTLERGGGPSNPELPADQLREWRIQYVKDFRRTMDYLETRGDSDMQKIAYFGSSWGGRVGSIIGAVEPRIDLMILEHGGFPNTPRTPETDEVNFAPRVHVPVLMINGSFDHVFPPETSQKPMFAALGTPAQDKVHFVFEGGHISPRKEIIRVVLDWLDKYFGPPSKIEPAGK